MCRMDEKVNNKQVGIYKVKTDMKIVLEIPLFLCMFNWPVQYPVLLRDHQNSV